MYLVRKLPPKTSFMVSLSAQVDTEFAEKKDSHDIEFEVELRETE